MFGEIVRRRQEGEKETWAPLENHGVGVVKDW
jgi:hypothetical protein